MSAIGFGIVGCGNIAHLHAQALQAIPQARLVGFCGKGAERASSLGKKYGVEWSVDLVSFLARPEIQAVTLCTPSGTHMELGCQAAGAGKHVLVEKPIEVTMEKARRLVEECEKRKVHLGVIFQSRFLPSVEFLKRALGQERLGRIIAADAHVKWFRSRQYYESAPWRGTLALDGGGALINQSIHTIDLLQYLAGPVHSVFGLAQRQLHHDIEGEDTAVAVVQFKNGAVGVIEGSTSIYPGFSRRVEIHGEKGSVILDGNDIRVWETVEKGEAELGLAALTGKDQSSGASDPMSLEIGGHQRQMEDFIEAIFHDRPPRVDGREGMKALAIVLAIYRSAREKRLVEIEELTSSVGFK